MAVFVLFAAILSISRVNSPQNAKTGAPNEGTCGDAPCHTGINFLDGSIVLDGLPDVVLTDSTYTLRILINNPNGDGAKAGFQLTAIDAQNDSIGAFSNPSFSSAIQRRTNRVYWEHLPAKNFDMNNNVEYTVDWTAPSEIGDGIVKLYASSVISDGNGAATADLVLNFSDTVNIDNGVAPMIGEFVNVQSVSCYGEEDGRATMRVEGGRRPLSYCWNNGVKDSIATNLGDGLWFITVTDQDSSELIRAIRINQPDSLKIDVESTNARCPGDMNGRATITVTGGTRPYSYIWPDGENTNVRTGLGSGIYNVVIRDAKDCEKTVEIFISEPVFFIDSTDFLIEEISCFGEEDGSIDLRPGISTGTFNYSWSNGMSGPVIFGLGEGQFTVTIADINNCQEVYSFELEEPEVLRGTLSAQNVSAPGASDGTIRASISGGTRPYNYNWSNGEMTFEIEDLPIGEYELTVTDANECMLVLNAEVDEPDCMIQIGEDVFSTSCHMVCDGVICPRVFNGTPPYQFQWLDGSTDSCLTSVCPGSYRVTVTDSRDCEVVVNFGMNQPDPLVASSEVEDNICAGESEGSIQHSIFGGTPPYRTEPLDLDELASGIYAVTVYDANDCELIIVDTVMSPEPLNIVVESFTDPDSSESNGSIDIRTEGGVSPYFYFWVDQDGFSVGNTEDLSDLPNGCYTLTLIDINGCSFISDEICIGEPLSIEGFDMNSLSFYPSPVRDYLFVEGLEGYHDLWVKVYNSSGQLQDVRHIHHQAQDGKIKLDRLDKLSSGLYFIQLSDGNASTSLKIVKTGN